MYHPFAGTTRCNQHRRRCRSASVQSTRQMPASQQIPMCRAGGLAGARCGVERSPARGPTGPGAAIVRPRQPDRSTTSPATSASTWTSAPGAPVNVVQVVVGPTGFVGAPERGGRRLHPIHLRRSSQAGPHRDCRRPRGGIRAQVSTAALSRHAAPVRGCRSAISARRATWRERDRRRGRQRLSSARSMTSCSCCPRPGRCSW